MKLLDHPDVHRWLKTLDDNPGSADHALMFGDWLEENGFPAHAEMIRLHHSNAKDRLDDYDPGGRRMYTHNIVKGDPEHSLEIWKDGSMWLRMPHEQTLPEFPGGWTTFSTKLPLDHAVKLHDALTEEGARPSMRRRQEFK